MPHWRPHLQRASALIAQGDVAALQYAALELRLAIEALTYEKADSYRRYLPESFFAKTWQPPQLLERLTRIDPIADQSFTLRMSGPVNPGEAPDPESWQMVGEHRALSVAWLRKRYNMLGSMLHLPVFGGQQDIAEMRSRIESIASAIATSGTSTISGMSTAPIVSADCALCTGRIVASVPWVQSERTAFCLNPACEAEYNAEMAGEVAQFELRAYYHNCQCGNRMTFESRKLRDDQGWHCEACGQLYRVSQRWDLARVSGALAPQTEATKDREQR